MLEKVIENDERERINCKMVKFKTGQVLKMLKIPKHRLYYLFDSLQIKDKRDKYNHRIYSEKMIEEIRRIIEWKTKF